MLSEHSIKKLIFFVQWPITSYEVKAWHFDFLREKGFIVEVLDLSVLLNPASLRSRSRGNDIQENYIFKIDSYKKLNAYLSERVGDSVFIDYLANHSNVSIKTEKIYRTLKIKNARYVVISSGATPVMTFDKSPMGQFKKVISKIKKAFNFKLLLDYLGSKVILLLTRKGFFYPMPIKIFGGDSSEAMKLFITNRNLNNTAIVPINSFDYDSYIYSLTQAIEGLSADEKICVFLDEAITDHPDFAIMGIDYISAPEYFDSMNRLFDFLENELNLKVVVAAHPRSNYEKTSGIFKNRTIIKGQTAALTSKSDLVIMHMSTSVSFAIIGQKPVTIVKTEGMHNNTFLDKLVDNMANTIGTRSINIDRVELTKDLFKKEFNVEKYNNYLFKYIKSPKAANLPVWEIVVTEINKLTKEK